MKIIISTVGTSVLTNAYSNEKEKYNFLMGKPLNEEEHYKKQIQELEEDLLQRVKHEDFDVHRFSAETNSIDRIGAAEGDLLVFLTSDTLDGSFCGRVLAKVCEKLWKARCEVKEVKGLQVNNASQFRFVGVSELVQTVNAYLRRYEGANIILNPTGGFKAVVPYVTLLGLVEGLPVKYIFERSNQLIELPSAPLTFNLEKIKELGPIAGILAVDYVEEEKLAEAAGKSVYHLKEEFKDILAWEDGMVSLSAIAQILYERHLRTEGDQVKISRTVRKKFRQNPDLANRYEPIMLRMGDPRYRKYHEHPLISERMELKCFKLSRTEERIFYYEEGNNVYICDIIEDYDDYYRKINEGLKKDDYKNDFEDD